MTALHASIQRLLQQVADWTNEVNGPSSRAVGQLMALLELTNRPDESPEMQEYYEDTLPLEVRMAPFDEEVQQVVTRELCRLAAEPPAIEARQTYLNVLDSSLPWVAFEPVAELLVQRPGPAWSDVDIREALVAIQHMLDFVGMDESDPRYVRLQGVAAVVKRLHLGEEMAKLAQDDNQRVASVAESNLRAIEFLCDRFGPEKGPGTAI